MKEYADRDALVQQMGFSSYEAYLLSDLWAFIRSKCFESPERKVCFKCERSGVLLVLHHADYSLSTLVGTNDRALVSVCVQCHKDAEFDRNGRKRSLAEANKILGWSDQSEFDDFGL